MGGNGGNKALSRKSEKYYNLAKAHGFRSRAAFKLVQLNKKFDFLGSAKNLLDLCAAPGGWMQVAVKYMPVQSRVLGVDLVPIAPIPGASSFPGDITAADTRKRIAEFFGKEKCDVVLHDGAPNMGTNWDYDAYQQNELTLKALKLATQFLRKNGVFVTKVFRSKDYNSLQFVLQKFFGKVTATKPNASRNESAEIFVVCEGFVAPHSIDEKMLDPKFIFTDVEKEKVPATLKSFDPKKRPKKNRDGYSGKSDVLIFEKRLVKEFLLAPDPITLMYEANTIVWDEDARSKYWEKTPQTIREYMEDLKLITSKEAKELLRWRSEMRALNLEDKPFAEAAEAKPAAAEEVEVDEPDSEEELAALAERAERRARKAERKKREATKKRAERISRGMEVEGDEWDLERDEELFDLEAALGAALGHEMPEQQEEEEEGKKDRKRALEENLSFQEMVEGYLNTAHAKSKRPKVRVKGKLVAVLDPLQDAAEEEEGKKLAARRRMGGGGAPDWYSQELFAGVDAGLEDEAGEEKKKAEDEEEEEEEEEEKEEEEERVVDFEAEEEQQQQEEEEEAEAEAGEKENAGRREERLGLLRLGRAVVAGRASVKELVDDSFNRWTSGADGGGEEGALPEWFAEKEREYWRPFREELPGDAPEDAARLRGIADRPLKKVAEAKARRKRKAEMQMKRVAPKVAAIAGNSEMGQAERVKGRCGVAIAKLYKGVKPKERGRVYVISNRREQLGRKRVVKGKKKGAVRMVDKRLKRDKKKSTKRAEGAYGGGPRKHAKKG